MKLNNLLELYGNLIMESLLDLHGILIKKLLEICQKKFTQNYFMISKTIIVKIIGKMVLMNYENHI
jgi:hypothetical protein